MEQRERELVPTSVIIAAGIVGIVAANHFVMRAMPALMALDPYGLLELLAVGICAAVSWGLLTLRRWAWILAVLLSGVGCVFPLLMMQDLEAFKLQAGLSGGNTVVVQFLLFLEMASFSIFLLLMSDAGKNAFHNARTRETREAADTPTEHPAEQTASG